MKASSSSRTSETKAGMEKIREKLGVSIITETQAKGCTGAQGLLQEVVACKLGLSGSVRI